MHLHRHSFFFGAAVSAAAMTLIIVFGLGVRPTAAQQPALEQRVEALERELGELHPAVQRAQVVAAMYQLDSVGFHDLAEELAAGQLPPGALGPVRRARIAAQAVAWPHALQELHGELVAQLLVLEEALRTEDPAQAASPAELVHETEHDLSNAVYAWLSGAAPPSGH
jgi:hypothetical protein